MPDLTALLRDLTEEADQCRNDGANDIADLLDRARQALEGGGVDDSALVALLDFLDDVDTDAGFAWTKKDREEYEAMAGIKK